MRKHLLIYSVFIILIPSLKGQNIDSLLHVLDKTVQEREKYVEIKNEDLIFLKKDLRTHTTPEEQYRLTHEIFERYKNYQLDSALVYANMRLNIAHQLNDPLKEQAARLNMAEALILTGMYKEALDILQTESAHPQNDEQRASIYHLYHSLYMLMANYTLSRQEREEYIALEYQYKDSILTVLSPDNLGYKLIKSTLLAGEGDLRHALKYAEEAYHIFQSPHDIAMSAYTLSEIYQIMGNEEERKKYLIISAIGDLQAGVKEYISLWQVADILHQEGYVNRAYNYIKCSMEDAIFCNARYRALEISQRLPIINETYDIKMKEEKQKLILFLFIISILSVILILATLFIIRQLKALVKARRSLKEINKDLTHMNEHLNQLNLDLSESNIVKEEYIGYIFNLCSAYIDKLEDFRKKVNRKLKAGQNKEVITLTNSSSLVSDELKELYRNFDLIFLNLYPDFIEEFNTLLQEEEHILPKEGELLTPELRIYALVRLGISDSVKIAAFLHYSPQTVYNYRLKVRNKAKVARDNFPEAVRQIGRLREPK